MLNIKENCNKLKARLKQQYTSVTDNDLQCNNNTKGEMLERLQQKLGKTSEELYEIILKL
jgi:hypothetical protein